MDDGRFGMELTNEKGFFLWGVQTFICKGSRADIASQMQSENRLRASTMSESRAKSLNALIVAILSIYIGATAKVQADAALPGGKTGPAL